MQQQEQQQKIQLQSDDEEDLKQVKEKKIDLKIVEKYLEMFPYYNPIKDIKSHMIELQNNNKKEKEIWIKKLMLKRIFYKEEYQKQLKIWVIHASKNKQVMVLGVSLGYFTQELKILNTTLHNFSKHMQLFKYSPDFSNPKVIACTIKDYYFSVKKLGYDKQNFHIEWEKAVKQVFFMNLASALGTGPQMQIEECFDIYVYNKQIIWLMEMCLTEENALRYSPDNDFMERVSYKKEQQLWENLKINHLFKIMHLDIKNDNVGFSIRQNKWVFLDYGLSQIIKEDLGQRTSINFRGTIGFSSPEMIFNSTKGLPVDLYGNDAFGVHELDKVYKIKKQKSLVLYEPPQQHLIIKSYYLYYMINSLKYYFYFSNLPVTAEIRDHLKRIQGNYFQQDIYRFAFMLPDIYRSIRDIVQENSILESQSFKPNDHIFLVRMKKVKFSPPPQLQNQIENEHNCYKYPHFSEIKAMTKQKNEVTIDKLKKMKLSTEIQFAQKMNFTSKECKYEDRKFMCDLFLQINEIDEPEQGENSLEKVLLILYESSLTHCKQNVLRNILDSIILMELLPQEKLKSDMLAFLKKQSPIESKFKHYICWLQSLAWINSTISSIYSYIYLQSALFETLECYLSQLDSKEGHEYYLQQSLRYLLVFNRGTEFLSKEGYDYMVQMVRRWYFNYKIELKPDDVYDWRKALFIYFVFKLWQCIDVDQYSTVQVIYYTLASYSPFNEYRNSFSVPLYYHTFLYMAFQRIKDKKNRLVSNTFERYLGSYSFSNKLWIIFHQNMRKDEQTHQFLTSNKLLDLKIQKYWFPEIRCIYRGLILHQLIHFFSSDSKDEIKAILKTHEIQIQSFKALLMVFPYQQHNPHVHYFIQYWNLIYEMASIILTHQPWFEEARSQINKQIEQNQCEICKSQIENLLLQLRIKTLKKQNNVQQIIGIYQNDIQKHLKNGKVEKIYISVRNLFDYWSQNYNVQYRQKIISLFLTIRGILKNFYKWKQYIIQNVCIFEQFYFYFLNQYIKDSNNNQFLNYVVENMQFVKQRWRKNKYIKLYQFLFNTYIASQKHGMQTQVVIKKQIEISYKLHNHHNPYMSLFILGSLYQLYKTYLYRQIKYIVIFKMLKKIAQMLCKLHLPEIYTVGAFYYGIIQQTVPLPKRKSRKFYKQYLKISLNYYSPHKVFGFKLKNHYSQSQKYELNRHIRYYYNNLGIVHDLNS